MEKLRCVTFYFKKHLFKVYLDQKYKAQINSRKERFIQALHVSLEFVVVDWSQRLSLPEL